MTLCATTRKHYVRLGPKRMQCKHCGTVISTNALARAAHERGEFHANHRVLGWKRIGDSLFPPRSLP